MDVMRSTAAGRGRWSNVGRAGIAALAGLTLVLAAACTSESAQPTGDRTGSTQRAGSSTSASTSSTLDPELCPADRSLTVVRDDGATEQAMATTYADIVGTDAQSATFTFATTTIERDDARGVLQPTLEGDDVVVVVAVQTDAEITTGTFPPADAARAAGFPDGAPTVHLYAFYDSSGRVFGPQPTVEITAVTDTEVCGALSVPEELAAEAGSVSGRFIAERIDTGATRVSSTTTP